MTMHTLVGMTIIMGTITVPIAMVFITTGRQDPAWAARSSYRKRRTFH